jgi:polysaccharide export outer membrane protein
MVYHRIRALIICLTVLTVGACGLPRGAAIQSEIVSGQNAESAPFEVVPVTRANIGDLQTWPVTGWAGDYNWFSNNRGPISPIIRTGDRIDLIIWDSQENSLMSTLGQKSVKLNDIMVGADGMIFIPYIDRVFVRGETTESARAVIAKELEAVIPSAQVQLLLTPGPDNSVDAVSGFRSPGTYPLVHGDVSILSLIAQAGGISPELSNPLIRVLRDGRSYEILSDTLYEKPAANVIVRGGDQIVAEEDRRYFVALGATGIQKIMPFDRENVNAIEALAMLGGLSAGRANPKGVLILREYGRNEVRTDNTGPRKRQIVFAIDLTSADGLFAANNFKINPKDVLVATESPINSIRTVFGLIGSIVGIGNAVSN